jgi:electron transport complex protein RnfB
MMNVSLADRIDALLPQTQCQRCGHAGCRPYAEAIAEGRADINQCPPGGEATIQELATLLDREPLALDPAVGTAQELHVAVIDESACIGCTLCIRACPVDAIIGAAKRMHTVLTELCTGCELCLPPCPVDCITMSSAPFTWDEARAASARQRYDARLERLAGRRKNRAEPADTNPLIDLPNSKQELQAQIQAAIARTRAKRAVSR